MKRFRVLDTNQRRNPPRVMIRVFTAIYSIVRTRVNMVVTVIVVYSYLESSPIFGFCNINTYRRIVLSSLFSSLLLLLLLWSYARPTGRSVRQVSVSLRSLNANAWTQFSPAKTIYGPHTYTTYSSGAWWFFYDFYGLPVFVRQTRYTLPL